MRRAAELVLILFAVLGLVAAGAAEARMLPGVAMAVSQAGDCPHAAADPGAGQGGAVHKAGKTLAVTLCCFGMGSSILADAAESRPLRLAATRLRPASVTVPQTGSIAPEPPPPRA